MDDPGAQEMSLAAMVEYMEQSQQHPHGDGHHQQHHVGGGGPVGGGGEPHYDGIDPSLQAGPGGGAGGGYNNLSAEAMEIMAARQAQADAYVRQQQQQGLYPQHQQQSAYSPNAQYNSAYSPTPVNGGHSQQSYAYNGAPSSAATQQLLQQRAQQQQFVNQQQAALIDYVRQRQAAGVYANEAERQADIDRLQASMPAYAPSYDVSGYSTHPSQQQYQPSPSASSHANASFQHGSPALSATSSAANASFQLQQHQSDAGASSDLAAARGPGRPKGSTTKMKQEPSDDSTNGGSQMGGDGEGDYDPNAIRKTGRPKGSKNKAKEGDADASGDGQPKKPRGRPKGSKNKPKAADTTLKSIKAQFPNAPLIPANQFIAVNLAGNAPQQQTPQAGPGDPFLAPGSMLSGDQSNPFNLAPLPPVYIHHPPMAFPGPDSTYNIFPQHHPPMQLAPAPPIPLPSSYAAPRRGRPPGSKDKGPRRSKTTGELLGQWKVKVENGEEEYEKIEKAKRPRGRPRGSGASTRAKRTRDTSDEDEDEDDDDDFDEVVTGGRRDGDEAEGGTPSGRPKRESRRAAVAAVAAVKAFVEPKPKRVRRVKAPPAPVIGPLFNPDGSPMLNEDGTPVEGPLPVPIPAAAEPVLGPDGQPLPVDPNAPALDPEAPLAVVAAAAPLLGPDGQPLPVDPNAPAVVYEEYDELESSDEFDDVEDDSGEDSDYQEKKKVKRDESEGAPRQPAPVEYDADGNPIVKKRRGRPPGSKNKNAVNRSAAALMDSDGESIDDGPKGRGKRKRQPPQAFISNPLLPHLARESSTAGSSGGTPPLEAAYPPGMAPPKRGRGRPKKQFADLAESTRRRRMGEGRILEGRDEIAYGIFDGDGQPAAPGGGGLGGGLGGGEEGVASDLQMLRGLLGGGATGNAEASGSGTSGNAQIHQQLPPNVINEALQNLSSSGALNHITQDQFFQAAGNDADQAIQLAQALLLQAQASSSTAAGEGGAAPAAGQQQGGEGETPWMSAFLTEIQGLRPEAGGGGIAAPAATDVAQGGSDGQVEEAAEVAVAVRSDGAGGAEGVQVQGGGQEEISPEMLALLAAGVEGGEGVEAVKVERTTEEGDQMAQ